MTKNKYIYLLLVTLFVITNSFGTNGVGDPKIEVYVSPNGSDQNSGTKEEPFATLEKARNYIRTVRNLDNSLKSTVILREGIYKLENTFLLEAQDSNIEFKAFQEEVPVLTGGRTIKNWRLLKEDLSEISNKSKGNIWTADIPKNWLFHYMFVNGQRAERSKSTNVHWLKWPKDHDFGEPEVKGQLVTFKNKKQLKYIPSNGDAEMLCIMYQYGVMGNGVITDVNPKAGTLRWNSKQTNLRGSRDGAERGYRFENALCFIDAPGEWAVDSEKGIVYYWPKENEEMSSANVIAPKLNELVRLQGDEKNEELVKNIVFENITFNYTDRLPENKWPDEWLTRQWENVDAAVYLSGVENCTFRKCNIYNSGTYGITLNHHCQNITIEGCEIGWTGSGGIFLEGYGPGTLDVNKNNIITRNYIHDHGLGNYWHSPSIQIYQSGSNQINNNILQRSAYSSISMVGMYYGYLNKPSLFFKGNYEGQWHTWKYFKVRSQDFSKVIQDGIRNETFKFDRESIKPYLHSRNNLIENNIISEPHSKLNEGGAIYAWCTGKYNIIRSNAIFKSRGMPASSIIALDDVAEYFIVTDNVYWIHGPILNGVGARQTERGNVISRNIRVNYIKAHAQSHDRDKIDSWYTNDYGRAPLDKLVNRITKTAKEKGGWPVNAEIGVPSANEKVTQYGVSYDLPENAHVTIEEQ
ncbi:MAG: right-handed parallel beta-helix repeat-containing protein [Flavobacteriales bacterium]|nr:right-handed parallel beta-helix repeat-containing protein [Flavobacteriales bacterium]